MAQRSLSMIAKHCDQAVPECGVLSDDDKALLAAADGLLEQCRAAMDEQAIHLALTAVWAVIGDANRYFDSQQPWALRKTDMERMKTVLYVAIEVIRQAAILVQPVMPESAAKLLDLLGVSEDARQFDRLGEAGRLKSGTALPTPVGVFPRYVAPETAEQGA
jgi:methionyl-tRNA synthetase